jgi:hypothetical protein
MMNVHQNIVRYLYLYIYDMHAECFKHYESHVSCTKNFQQSIKKVKMVRQSNKESIITVNLYISCKCLDGELGKVVVTA